jgi:hypothetical protein
MKFLCLVFAWLPLACNLGDKTAEITGPPYYPLAQGSYAPVAFVDGCPVTQNMTCKTEWLTSLEYFVSDQPSIAEIVDTSTLSADFGIASPYALHALKAGKATLRARGTFSDGTVRSATATFEVRAVTSVKLPAVCPNGTLPPYYVSYGGQIRGAVALYAGDQQLSGLLPDALAGQGLVISYPDPRNDQVWFSWQAPNGPSQIVITSPYDPTLSVFVSSYTVMDVTSIKAESYPGPPVFLYGPGPLYVSTQAEVNGHPTCDEGFSIGKTLTPDVCTGPDGQAEWTGTYAFSLDFQVLKEGVCQISLGTVGGAYVTLHEESIFFPNGPEPDPSWIIGYACDQNDFVACARDHAAALKCVNGDWKALISCPSDQICDYVSAADASCPGTVDCLQCRALRQ